MELAVFDLPFADAPARPPAGAADELRRWLLGFGYPPTDVERLFTWDPVMLTARFHPWITDSEFALATEVLAWMILFDDACDGLFRDDPGRMAEIVQAHLSLMDTTDLAAPAARDLSPSQHAFQDIWHRLCQGMSSSWTARADASWRSCLSAFPAEAANRRRRTPMSTAEYLDLRAETGGVKINLAMSERLRHAEIREDLAGTPLTARMTRLTQDIVDAVQDALSLAKEKKHGEVNNLVISIAHETGCGEQQAIREVIMMVRGWTDEFLACEASLPALCDSAGVPVADRLNLYRYADSMRTLMRGVDTWCRASARYHVERLASSPSRTGPSTSLHVRRPRGRVPGRPGGATSTPDGQGGGHGWTIWPAAAIIRFIVPPTFLIQPLCRSKSRSRESDEIL